MDIVVFQTADAFRYQTMLRATSRTVTEFCRRSSCQYESFTGIKRGVWPWQTTFNRILMFSELVDRGFNGWAIYLDADAYICDLDFDIRSYLSDKQQYAAILASACATPNSWDVNAGVCFINTAHPQGRELIQTWKDAFFQVSDAQLLEASTWMESKNDQDLLQIILRTNEALMGSVFVESTDLINSNHATFIKQVLRQYNSDLPSRTELIRQQTDRVLNLSTTRTPDLEQDVDSLVAQSAVTAIYQALLHRDPDDSGNINALTSLKALGLKEGIRNLVRDILASSEFHNLPS